MHLKIKAKVVAARTGARTGGRTGGRTGAREIHAVRVKGGVISLLL